MMLLSGYLRLHAMESKQVSLNPDKLVIFQELATREVGNKFIVAGVFFACAEIYAVYQDPSMMSNHIPTFITSLIGVPLSLYYVFQNKRDISHEKKTN